MVTKTWLIRHASRFQVAKRTKTPTSNYKSLIFKVDRTFEKFMKYHSSQFSELVLINKQKPTKKSAFMKKIRN